MRPQSGCASRGAGRHAVVHQSSPYSGWTPTAALSLAAVNGKSRKRCPVASAIALAIAAAAGPCPVSPAPRNGRPERSMMWTSILSGTLWKRRMGSDGATGLLWRCASAARASPARSLTFRRGRLAADRPGGLSSQWPVRLLPLGGGARTLNNWDIWPHDSFEGGRGRYGRSGRLRRALRRVCGLCLEAGGRAHFHIAMGSC